MSNTDHSQLFSQTIGSSVENVHPIAENKYCSIHEGTTGGGKAIFKIYTTGDEKLVQLEAKGIEIYHSIAEGGTDLSDCRVLGLDSEKRIIAMEFVPGARLSDRLRTLSRSKEQWREGVEAMRTLGAFLRELHEKTRSTSEKPDPFHEEYLLYCSQRLAQAPVAGRLLFPNALQEARDLTARYFDSKPVVSMAHGDFVLRNIHIDQGRVGIIDFANTLMASHPLNDYYNMRQGLDNMLLAADFRRQLWDGFSEGVGDLKFPDIDHEFFYEYHRRRWLMLNLRVKQPTRWLKAARGMLGFARPWTSIRSGPSP